jgi:3-oxoacyl-[acyl-carrier protein] reductase
MKNILILGGSKNLGKFLSIQFSKTDKVINLSRTGLNLKKEKNLNNKNLSNYKLDAANKKSVKNFLSKLFQKIKKIDLVIYCIGDSEKKKINQNNSQHWHDSFSINFLTFANFLECYEVEYKKKPTKIIVISSIAGLKPIGAPIEYSVFKKALTFYCKLKALELANDNIKINIISPGNIYQKGNLWDKKIIKDPKKTKKYIKDNVPLNTFCSTEQIFEMCKYLLSKSGNNITGSDFIIDPGQNL